VLRSASPVETIGGGVVIDPLPAHRRARPRGAVGQSPGDRLERALADAGTLGLDVASLPVKIGAPPREVAALLAAVGARARLLDGRLFAEHAVASVADRLLAAVHAYHERSPLEPGAPLQSVRAQLASGAAGGRAVDARLADEALRRTVEAGALEVHGAIVRRRGWRPMLSAAQERVREELLIAIQRAGHEPPSVSELDARFGAPTSPLLRLLERAELIVQVEGDRYYARSALDGLINRLRTGMAPGREYAPPALRELLGFSRKFLIPFLEYCDRTGVTERRATGRVLKGS
jgi:selenocysteine-specific elongation factor